MLGQPSSVPGFEVAAASRADRADPARRRAAQLRHPQRHAGRLDRPRPAAVDRRPADLARRPRRRRVGHAQGPGLPHRPVPSCPPQGSAHMLNLAEYSKKTTALADYLPWACLVGPGIVLNKDGIVPAHAALSRSRPRQRHRGRARLHQRAPQQCAEALRRRLGAVLRGRARPGQPAIPAPALPIRPRGWSIRSATPPSVPTARTTRAGISSPFSICRHPSARAAGRALPVRALAMPQPSRPSRTPSSNGS